MPSCLISAKLKCVVKIEIIHIFFAVVQCKLLRIKGIEKDKSCYCTKLSSSSIGHLNAVKIVFFRSALSCLIVGIGTSIGRTYEK